jgi:hypothetical protein
MKSTKPNLDDFVEGAKASKAEKPTDVIKTEFELLTAFKTFPLRIPENLHAAATEAAKRKGKGSLHRYILELIREDVLKK